MKKIVLFILTVTCVQYVSAQSIAVLGSNTITSSDPCLQTSTGLTIKNLSVDDTLKILCEKVIVDTTAGTTNHFCWGGQCYGTTTYLSSDYTELNPGQSNNFDFTGYYDAYCDIATASIEYCFFPQSNPSDRSCITILYNGNGSSTFINNHNDFITNGFYPNPASNHVNVSYNEIENGNIKIIDILGNTVRDLNLNSGSAEKIYIGDLNKGVYFGNLFQNGKLITIKKLIVK